MKLEERVEFRLDAQMKRALQELARLRGQSLGETIRQLLQQVLFPRQEWRSRREAARHLVSLGIRALPPPSELEEEIHRAFGPSPEAR
ncbi:MAG: ribbon-helix-helix domain-containing protein [candidate division WOR-3 bacterium]